MTKAITKAAGVFAMLGMLVGTIPASAFAQTTPQVTDVVPVVTASSTVPTDLNGTSTTTTVSTDTSTSTASTTPTTTSNATSSPLAPFPIIFPIIPFPIIPFPIVPPATTTPTQVVIVTPTNTQGFSTADTRPGGQVNYVADATSPYPNGALELLTNSSTAAKAQYLNAASTTLASVTQLSYYTKQMSGPAGADPSYQLIVDLNGAAAGGFTTFVYEPYENGTVTPGVWQLWNVATGKMWSSRSFNDDSSCNITAGGGGAPYYTLTGLKASCPNAVVLGFGVNIGSNNPSYDVYTDGVNFNGTAYNFEQDASSSTQSQVVVVKPSNMQGWTAYNDMVLNGTSSSTATSTFVADAGSPMPPGALQLSTPTTTDEILFDRSDATMTPVSNINISYASKRLAGAAYAAPAYVLGIDEDGSSLTTADTLYAYYEPVYNGGSNYDNWNTWQVNQSSQFYSHPGQMVGTKGGQNGANFFTLQDVRNAYPNAKVNEYSINQGSGNQGWVTNVDAVVTPSATYNFEQDASATTTTPGGSNNGGTTDTRTVGGGGGGGGGGSNFSSGNGSSSGTTGGTTTTTTTTTGGQVLGAAAFNFTRDLHLGLRGADVTELQVELIAAGYLKIASATGYFGKLTRAAVALWQAEHNITPAAGYFGPISRAAYAANGGFHILVTPVTTTH